MKRPFLLSSLILVGCSTSPLSYSGVTPRSASDGYTCAMQQMNGLGYTVEDADRDAGFIRGTKPTSGLGTAIFFGKKYHDLMTVVVFDGVEGTTTMRVTAGQVEESGVLIPLMGNTTVKKPTDDGIADAHELLAQCGVPEANIRLGMIRSDVG